MIIVALLECKSGAIATNDACLAQLFIAHFFPQPYNQLHINALSLHAQKLKNFTPKILLCARLIVLSIRNANIVFVKLQNKRKSHCVYA